MKICEYENVRCPYCGESEQLVDECKTTLNQHQIRCHRCLCLFFIPCED